MKCESVEFTVPAGKSTKFAAILVREPAVISSCGPIASRSALRAATVRMAKPLVRAECLQELSSQSGTFAEDNGECIPIGQCKCQQDGLEFQAGYKEIRQEPRGLELCTCLNGLWRCKLATVQEIQSFPKANDLKAKWQEFRIYHLRGRGTGHLQEHAHQRTLFTNSLPFWVQMQEWLCAGFEEPKVRQACRLPLPPWRQELQGEIYRCKLLIVAAVQSDCNTCTCKNGKWQCTDRQCTAECSAWGDSHYKTFDGKHFDYQGQCDFVLAKGSLGSDSFDVTIQNVPCGSLGTSCSKSVTLR
ncbi:hypothetical protein YQE_01626, partial [Dendroctonus ponderosae]